MISFLAQAADQSGSVSLVGVVLTALFSLWLIHMGRRNEKLQPLIFLGGVIFIANCAVTYNAIMDK